MSRGYAVAIAICAAALLMSSYGHADATDGPTLEAVVVTATAIPGTTIDIDKIPGNVQVLSAADPSREGSASLTTALTSNLSSVNINDDLGDPFQPDSFVTPLTGILTIEEIVDRGKDFEVRDGLIRCGHSPS